MAHEQCVGRATANENTLLRCPSTRTDSLSLRPVTTERFYHAIIRCAPYRGVLHPIPKLSNNTSQLFLAFLPSPLPASRFPASIVELTSPIIIRFKLLDFLALRGVGDPTGDAGRRCNQCVRGCRVDPRRPRPIRDGENHRRSALH